MKKLAIGLGAAALAAMLSGCAYDDYGYGYDSGYYGSPSYGYGYDNSYRYRDRDRGSYYYNGRRFDCRYDYDRRYC